jgi:phenylpropionate dioxygenase-like ring-hydroxylating dioxygenase large terminal subunit
MAIATSAPIIGRNSALPTGWFQVEWSADLKPGQIKPLRYFGHDMVLYRGLATGRAVVLDAYCPHLGAHLGYQLDAVDGDTGDCGVDGDNILCPWHKWSWDPQGENVDIPYSERRFRGKGPDPWHVREINGTILVWHDVLGRAPTWEPPVLPECEEGGDFYPIHPWSIKDWKRVSVRPQQIMENSADFAHLNYVHRHYGQITLHKVDTDGPYFSTDVTTTFDTPRGKIPGRIRPAAWGVGLLSVRLSGIHDIVHIANTTPVDDDTSDWFTALAVRRISGDDEPPKFARALLAGEHREAERDLHIWSHAKWVDRPPFPREEAPGYRELRKWAAQFYPTIENGEPGKPIAPNPGGESVELHVADRQG